MSKKKQALQAILDQQMLPLFYHESAEKSIAITGALYEAGIRSIEYTNRGEAALENFRQLKKRAGKEWPGLQLGIGTIKTKKTAQRFIDAGADYIICPSMNEEVAETVADEGLLWIPGCMTPTEIAGAEEAGASLVKIFPGNILGPGYISAIRDLFPGLKFMPTGGVEAETENLRAWFRSGVVAVGMGSKLVSKDVLEGDSFTGLRAATKEALRLVHEAAQLR